MPFKALGKRSLFFKITSSLYIVASVVDSGHLESANAPSTAEPGLPAVISAQLTPGLHILLLHVCSSKI